MQLFMSDNEDDDVKPMSFFSLSDHNGFAGEAAKEHLDQGAHFF